MKKIILNLLLAAVLFSSCEQKKVYEVEPPKVVTETVGEATCEGPANRSYVGTVEEGESVSMSFTSMGTLKRVLVSEGQAVSVGQLLAELDDTQARNLLDGAKASAHQAEDAIARYKQLYDKGSLAESKWVEAQSKLEEARASLRGAEKTLADCRLTASMAGVVGEKQAHAGSTVLPSQSVLTIYGISHVKVKVSVPENEIAQITSDTPSHIEVPSLHLQLEGGKIEKGIVADQLTHTYDIRIRLNNPEMKLLPGMVCQVTLGDGNTADGAPAPFTVPVRCIQQAADGKHFVWVVDDDKTAQRQDVTIGDLTGNRIAITSGLSAGQKVIITGYQKVSEGQSVNCK